jgi:hypothetical protein
MVKKIIFITLFLVVCMTTVATAQDDKFEQRVILTGLVSDVDSILFSSHVYFYPRKKGLSLLGGGKRIKGQFVLTDDSLAVLEFDRWNKVYEIIHQQKYEDIDSVEILGGSVVIRLVTKTKKTGKYNSFEIMDGRNSVSANSEKTRKAKNIIMAGMRGFDVQSVAMSDDDLIAVSAKQQDQQMQSLEERIQRLERAANQPSAESDYECDCKCAE